METGAHAPYLRPVGILSSLDDAALEELGAACERRTVAEGEVVVAKGEGATELFVVLEGRFVAYHEQKGIGFERVLSEIGKGEVFGEVALLSGGLRTASVRAEETGELLVLTREMLLLGIRNNPAIAEAVCMRLGQYVRSSGQGDSGIPFVRLVDFPEVRSLRKYLPEKIERLCKTLPLALQGEMLTVGMVDPQDAATRHFLEQVIHPLKMDLAAIAEADFAEFLHVGTTRTDEDDSAKLELVLDDGEVLGGNDTDEILAAVFARAIRAGASDLHLEPRRERLQVRMRIDGNLVDSGETIEPALGARIISRLKILADLDITGRRTPQDGSFALYLGSREINIRVATLPTKLGEKIALRLVEEGGVPLDLNHLVLVKPVAIMMRDLFLQPNGLTLVTGPTGGGKTTTLYAGLNAFWAAHSVTNVVTIEDPIDIRLPYANQVAVHEGSGLTFSRILRSVLRQDPDVLLVGEIRDKESAAIAFEAATTGHLVLSSLHTHSSFDALARIRSLEVEPFMVASALRGIISQRLLPAVCLECRAQADSESERQAARELRQRGLLTEEDLAEGRLQAGTGCPSCRESGSRGRVAAYEVLSISPGIKALIESAATEATLRTAVGPGEFIPMESYVRSLLLDGVVSPGSVLATFPSPPSAEMKLS